MTISVSPDMVIAPGAFDDFVDSTIPLRFKGEVYDALVLASKYSEDGRVVELEIEFEAPLDLIDVKFTVGKS